MGNKKRKLSVAISAFISTVNSISNVEKITEIIKIKFILKEVIKTVSYTHLYTFECSDKLAKVYFAQFYDEIEIIEPESLRESFKENFKRTYEMYK